MTLVFGEDLYLGGVMDVQPEFLQSHNIKIIINVAKECNYDLTNLPHCQYYHYDIVDDNYDISAHFDTIIQILNNKSISDGVLIHCFAGMSRSPTIILAYLIRVHRMSLLDGLNSMLSKRPIRPNPYFMEQLMTYERNVLGTNSYEPFLDDYVVNYITNSLRWDSSDNGIIKWIYISENRDIWKTIAFLNNPHM